MNQTLELPREARSDTKDRILNAAERLFAELGFEGTSLRKITTAAGVNLAAVNYHFQSKDQLIQALVVRNIVPVNLVRFQLLDRIEAEHAAGPLPLDDVVEAFIAPMLIIRGRPCVPRLLGMLFSQPADFVTKTMTPAVQEVIDRFRPALMRALPGARLPDVALGMHFAIGSMAHFLVAGKMLAAISGGQMNEPDSGLILKRMVRYVSAGLRALAEEEKSA
jgi:AcrR family transcriptional regulator